PRSRLSPTWLVNWRLLPKFLGPNTNRLRSVGLSPPSNDSGQPPRARTRLGPTVAIAPSSPLPPSQPADRSSRDWRSQSEPKSQRQGRLQFRNASACLRSSERSSEEKP